MAESSLVNMNTLYYCSAEHVGCETVSTDIYKLMCKMHMPVYLFLDAWDENFVTYHYHVSYRRRFYKKIHQLFFEENAVLIFFFFYLYIEC